MKTRTIFTTLMIGMLSLTACGGSNSKGPFKFITDLKEVKEIHTA